MAMKQTQIKHLVSRLKELVDNKYSSFGSPELILSSDDLDHIKDVEPERFIQLVKEDKIVVCPVKSKHTWYPTYIFANDLPLFLEHVDKLRKFEGNRELARAELRRVEDNLIFEDAMSASGILEHFAKFLKDLKD